jgi:hypothetical protein
MIKGFFVILGAIVLWLGVIVGLSYGTVKMYDFFAPRYRAIDSKVFHESEQYNEGMVRDLTELQRQYVTSDEAGKEALRPIIRHRFEVYPENKMPSDLRNFYDSIK